MGRHGASGWRWTVWRAARWTRCLRSAARRTRCFRPAAGWTRCFRSAAGWTRCLRSAVRWTRWFRSAAGWTNWIRRTSNAIRTEWSSRSCAFGPGAFGGGGPPNPDAFGPGMFIAPVFVQQGDENNDQRLTQEELLAPGVAGSTNGTQQTQVCWTSTASAKDSTSRWHLPRALVRRQAWDRLVPAVRRTHRRR